jgi:hypothetical protein
MTHAHATTNHQRIKQWVEQRGGHPAAVASTGEHGLLRIDFEPSDESLEPIDWETFFETFDKKELAFLYQDTTRGGQLSRFNKFIDRGSTEASDLSEDAEAGSTQSRSSARGGSARSKKVASAKGQQGARGSSGTKAGTGEAVRQGSQSSRRDDEIDVNDEDQIEEEIEDQLEEDDDSE